MKVLKNLSLSILVLMAPLLAVASLSGNAFACDVPQDTILGIPPWYTYLEGEEIQQLDSSGSPKTETACQPVVRTRTDLALIMAAILTILIRVAGIAAFIFLLYGGFMYLTSNGNPENVKNAGTTLLNAAIGLAIAISGTVLVNFFAGRLTG